jgi:tryptophan 2,3-dioxygenase
MDLFYTKSFLQSHREFVDNLATKQVFNFEVSMHKNKGPVYYGDYLQLSKLLDTQLPLSRKFATKEDGECHDEMLFIIVHQAYELWFKQIIHELNLVIKIFAQDYIPENQLSNVFQKLNRVKKIQSILIDQLDIIETMTPMDFLEFRDLLIPASGFQSVQFREVEIKMGLTTDSRIDVDREFFMGRLSEDDKKRLIEVEKSPSILKLMEKWLERLPFTNMGEFNFWDEFKKSIDTISKEDEEIILKNSASLSELQKNIQLENLRLTRENFQSLFDSKKHQMLVENRQRTLSQKAILNALFILLYRDEPMLAMPFNILTSMMDIDENFTSWRYRHALMAQRMLGTKIGTGGSSGHVYLKRAADNNRVFLDLFNLSTYIIPRSRLPIIPEGIKKQLSFYV